MSARRVWFALCFSSTLVSGCVYIDLANFLPSAARIDRTFGQLYERAGVSQISHYVVVTIPEAPADTFSLRTLSNGTIEYIAESSPSSDEMGNCLILRPKHYLTSTHDFSGFEPLPDEDELVFAYCHLDEASVRAAARALYADPRRLGGASATDLDQAANSFIRHEEGFTLLDVESQTDAPTSSDRLGNALSNELYFAAFTEDDSPVRQYVNPIPYLAAAFGSTTRDTVPPTIEEIVVQTSQSGRFGVDTENHPIVGDSIAVPLPRHFLRVAIRTNERTAREGRPTVPYAISTHLTSTTGDPRLRSRGRGLLNAFYYTQRAALVFAAYGTSEGVVSDIGAGRFYQFVPWNKTWPPPEEDDDAFNALLVSENMVLDLNSISDGEEVFPGGAYQLQLTVSDGATSAHSRTILFQLRGGVTLEVIADANDDGRIDADERASSLRIARWDNAYGPAPDFLVRNNADPDNFVEQDPSRFNLIITDPVANRDALTPEIIQAGVGTANIAATNDNLTTISFEETDANSGVFVSRSQLLTANDRGDPPLACAGAGAVDCEDDKFWVHDGAAGPVADDDNGDRTHEAAIDGSLRVVYTPADTAADRTWDIPVCPRVPEGRRRVHLRVTIFTEPFRNFGLDGRPSTHDRGEGNVDAGGRPIFDFDDLDGDGQHDADEPSEPFMDLSTGQNFYCPDPAHRPRCISGSRGALRDDIAHQVDADVARANIAWAPACLTFEVLRIRYDDAPVDPATDLDIRDNSGLLDAPRDINIVISEFTPPSIDTVEVFYAGLLSDALGRAASPVSAGDHPALGGNTFIFMSTYLEPDPALRLSTLLHELGHVLSNGHDSRNTQPIFYPADRTFADDAVNRYRRFTRATMDTCLTVRDPAAAHRSDSGNTLLRPY